MIKIIKRFLVTGDCHRDFSRFRNYSKEIQQDAETAVIILGDVALNWTLNDYDNQIKNYLTKNYKFHIYCVRGNHEARPQDVPDMKSIYDPNVNGFVFEQEKWPTIHYFQDFGVYWINGLRTAVIGGAYSVDKWYRLGRGLKWFEDEQLSVIEQQECKRSLTLSSNKYDLVLTHTCPVSWEPTDLFLSVVNQSKVDKSMELFLEDMKDTLDWDVWLFAHYHTDRIEHPFVEIFFKNTESIDNIYDRWQRYKEAGELDWWLAKGPLFYA